MLKCLLYAVCICKGLCVSRLYDFMDFGLYRLLYQEFSMFINHFCRSVRKCSYDLSRSSRYDVDMFYALIKSVCFHIFFCHLFDISCPTFYVRISDSNMSIPLWSSHVFIIQCFSHKLCDTRKPTVRQRKFSDFIRVGNTDNFSQ